MKVVVFNIFGSFAVGVLFVTQHLCSSVKKKEYEDLWLARLEAGHVSVSHHERAFFFFTPRLEVSKLLFIINLHSNCDVEFLKKNQIITDKFRNHICLKCNQTWVWTLICSSLCHDGFLCLVIKTIILCANYFWANVTVQTDESHIWFFNSWV